MAGEQSAYSATGNPIIITDTYMSDIADAIRTKTGSLDTYTPAQMAAAISAIETGGSSNLYLEAQPIRYTDTNSWYSLLKSTTSSTSSLRGLGKQNGDTFRTIVEELTHHTFIITATKTVDGISYVCQLIYTPSGYQYSKQQGYHWWAPTYELRSLLSNYSSYKIDYGGISTTSSSVVACPLMQGLATACFSIDEMELDTRTTKNITAYPANQKVDLWLYSRKSTGAASDDPTPNAPYNYYGDFRFLLPPSSTI